MGSLAGEVHMRIFSTLFTACGLLLVAGATADSRDIKADAPSTPMMAQAERFCPEVEAPVCATKNGKRVRYGNSCKAERDGATDITAGACDATK